MNTAVQHTQPSDKLHQVGYRTTTEFRQQIYIAQAKSGMGLSQFIDYAIAKVIAEQNASTSNHNEKVML